MNVFFLLRVTTGALLLQNATAEHASKEDRHEALTHFPRYSYNNRSTYLSGGIPGRPLSAEEEWNTPLKSAAGSGHYGNDSVSLAAGFASRRLAADGESDETSDNIDHTPSAPRESLANVEETSSASRETPFPIPLPVTQPVLAGPTFSTNPHVFPGAHNIAQCPQCRLYAELAPFFPPASEIPRTALYYTMVSAIGCLRLQHIVAHALLQTDVRNTELRAMSSLRMSIVCREARNYLDRLRHIVRIWRATLTGAEAAVLSDGPGATATFEQTITQAQEIQKAFLNPELDESHLPPVLQFALIQPLLDSVLLFVSFPRPPVRHYPTLINVNYFMQTYMANFGLVVCNYIFMLVFRGSCLSGRVLNQTLFQMTSAVCEAVPRLVRSAPLFTTIQSRLVLLYKLDRWLALLVMPRIMRAVVSNLISEWEEGTWEERMFSSPASARWAEYHMEALVNEVVHLRFLHAVVPHGLAAIPSFRVALDNFFSWLEATVHSKAVTSPAHPSAQLILFLQKVEIWLSEEMVLRDTLGRPDLFFSESERDRAALLIDYLRWLLQVLTPLVEKD